MATLSTIKEQAGLVKSATLIGENTALRVGGVLLDIANYISDNVPELKTLATTLQNAVTSLQSGLATETAARTEGDETLQDALNVEVSARGEADATNLARILAILQGTGDEVSAYLHPYIKIEDFATGAPDDDGRHEYTIKKLNEWLDGVSFTTENPRHHAVLGRCKVYIDGVDCEVYNQVISYANDMGMQFTLGALHKGSDTALTTSWQFCICYRVKASGTWNAWNEISADTIYTKSDGEALAQSLGKTISALHTDNWDEAYNFVKSISESGTQDAIDKWNEILHFINSLGDTSLDGLMESVTKEANERKEADQALQASIDEIGVIDDDTINAL